MDELGKQGVLCNADGKEAYDPEDGGGDTDPDDEGMECESLLDSEGTGNVYPRDQAADDSTTVEPVAAAAGTSADTGQPKEGPVATVQSPGGVDGHWASL